MTAGRPTKLTPELLIKAQGYILQCVDEVVETDKGAVAYVLVNLPTVVGFARFLGIHKDTVYEWRKENKEFSDLLSDVEDAQEEKTLKNGLGGLYNPKIASMILAKRGYAEKTETDITSKGEKLQGDNVLALATKAAELLKEEKL